MGVALTYAGGVDFNQTTHDETQVDMTRGAIVKSGNLVAESPSSRYASWAPMQKN